MLPERDMFPPLVVVVPVIVVAVSVLNVGVLLIDITAEPLDIQTPAESAVGSVHVVFPERVPG